MKLSIITSIALIAIASSADAQTIPAAPGGINWRETDGAPKYGVDEVHAQPRSGCDPSVYGGCGTHLQDETPQAHEQPDPDKPYIEYVKELVEKFQNGESITDDEIQLLMDKLKLTHEVDLEKVDINTAIQTVLANNENFRNGKSGEIFKIDLALQAIEYLKDTNSALYEKLKTDIENGYAVPGITDIIDPKAGEKSDSGGMEDRRRRRLGVAIDLDSRWPNGQIKYKVVTAGNGMAVYTEHILPAMAVVEELTVLSFKFEGTVASEADMVPDDFVYILTTKDGCFADLGKLDPEWGWVALINIGSGCEDQGTVIHEILHCAGMEHQQAASYRDNYVTVNFNNIEAGFEGNWEKEEIHGYEGVYDYGSLMHYGEYGFAIDENVKTMDCHGHPCGQVSSMSHWDIFEINHFYAGNYNMNTDLVGGTIITNGCRTGDDWTDNSGATCTWYETNEPAGCPTWSGYGGPDGQTAGQACCHCQTCETGDSSWVDEWGDGCDWYEANEEPGCPEEGQTGGSEGVTANEACCYCQEGNPSPVPAPTPAPVGGGGCATGNGWTDDSGATCTWYENNEPSGCTTWSWYPGPDGQTAGQACCHCQGGSSGGCAMGNGWTDNSGATCTWYETNEPAGCATWSWYPGPDGQTAGQACCHCQGGGSGG